MNQSGQKVIGVLGGCGPYAGLHLVKSIFDETCAQKDQEHLPVYLSSVPAAITDRTGFLLDPRIDNPAHAIASLIAQMEKLGVDIAGIACNTSHAPGIFEVIQDDLFQAGCKIRLLHIIDETIAFLKETYPRAGTIGVLSSDGTYRTRLYDDRLAAAGYRVVRPSQSFQHENIHLCVYHPQYGIKAQSSPVTAWARERIATTIDFFQEQRVEVLVLGCTEFSLAVDTASSGGLGIIDSTTALARALIRETYPEKLVKRETVLFDFPVPVLSDEAAVILRS